MIEKDAFGFLLLIALMTIVVYLTRIIGYWIIGRLTIGPRLRKALNALPGAIVSASAAPILLQGGARAALAMGATAVVMVLVRKDSIAVAAGVAAGAAAFAFGI